MKIRIYQIDMEQDTKRAKFGGSDWVRKLHNGRIPSEIYRLVYDGETEAQTLEDVFLIFNEYHPLDYRGHSLSMSDVVEVIGDGGTSKFHYCEMIGFSEVEFDPSKIIGRSGDAQ